MTKATRVLCASHVAGNALLLWLGYYWLGTGETTMGRLVWSGLIALLVLCGALWLHGAAFAFFRFGERNALRPAFRAALAHLAPLFVLGIAALLIYGALAWWRDYSAQPAFKLASYLTQHLRKPVKPASVQAVFNGILWLVRWAALPVVLLPLASAIASKGWHGLRGESRGLRRRWLYWVEVAALCVAGLWLPLKLIAWVPDFHAFSVQMISFMLRLFIAYLLFTGALLLLELFSSAGSPRVSQVKTVSAP
jgi:hypothetical protein